MFVNNTDNFTLSSLTANQVFATIFSRIPKKWFPKPRFKNLTTSKLATVTLYIKPDGRFRPIGSYAAVPHKAMLSLASKALHKIAHHLPTFMNFNVSHIKSIMHRIAHFSATATKLNLEIFSLGYDIKDFFTAVIHHVLIPRVKFVLGLYKNFFKSNYISIPKFKSKTLPTLFKQTDDTRYYCININDLFEIIQFALVNAYFQVGFHILHQIAGLPMG